LRDKIDLLVNKEDSKINQRHELIRKRKRNAARYLVVYLNYFYYDYHPIDELRRSMAISILPSLVRVMKVSIITTVTLMMMMMMMMRLIKKISMMMMK
jgi:hypothetical protein